MSRHSDLPPRVKDQSEQRAIILAAIERWTRDRRKGGELMPDEIADLGSGERLVVFKHDDIAAARAYLAAFPNESAKPFVRQLIKWLCDNGRDGYCTLSVPRIAALLGRSDRTIRECLDELVACSLIREQPVSGKATRYWPVICRTFVDNLVPSMWFLDWAPERPRGRPRKTGNVIHAFEAHDNDVNIDRKTPAHSVQGFSGETEKTPANCFSESVGQQGENACHYPDDDDDRREEEAEFAQGQIPAGRRRRLEMDSEGEAEGLGREGEQAPIALPRFITSRLVGELREACQMFPQEGPVPMRIEDARRLAADAIEGCSPATAEYHKDAFRSVLAKMRIGAGTGTSGRAGACRYFLKAVANEAVRIHSERTEAAARLEAATHRIAVESERELQTHAAIQGKRIDAFDDVHKAKLGKVARDRPLTAEEINEALKRPFENGVAV
jgi:hypothetical protein